MALSKPVGDCTVAAHRLPALQEEIFPQNISRIIHPTSVDCIILYFNLKAASKANFKLFFFNFPLLEYIIILIYVILEFSTTIQWILTLTFF